jgi:CRISPR-associated protein Csb2
VFQALVEAASLIPTAGFLEQAIPGVRWLETLGPPQIAATAGQPAAAKYRLYVPDNVADKVAKSWRSGREASIAEYRTEKDVRPTRLLVAEEELATVHYLYSLTDSTCPHLDVLCKAARSITHLGWGIDMVVGDAVVLSEPDAARLPGERWLVAEGGAAQFYRVPIPGTLEALLTKHRAFLNRLGPEGFSPVPPLTTFRSVGYRRSTDPAANAIAAFSLLKPDVSGPRAFDTVRRTRDVAGMLRSAVARIAADQGWPESRINQFVHGTTPDGAGPTSGITSPSRFSYLPLPTIARYRQNDRPVQRVDAIRRVLIAAPAGCSEAIGWARRAMSGEDLRDEAGVSQALLTLLPRSDDVLRGYLDAAEGWSTVTPLLLPRHHGYDPDEAESELRLAFVQAGYSPDLVARLALEWRRVGFRAGVDLTSKYLPPENLANKPRYHVRVRFPQPVPGPIVVGSGRFRGFGLFARE